MLKLALALARKDLSLALRGAGLVQSILLGLLLVFMFSLSQKTGSLASGQMAAAIFWLSSLFCQTLVFNMLFAFEETQGARTCLLLSPAPVTDIFLGKALAGFVLICQQRIQRIRTERSDSGFHPEPRPVVGKSDDLEHRS